MRNLVVGLCFAGLISLELTACAHWPGLNTGQSGGYTNSFWNGSGTAVDQALNADRTQRAALWQQLQESPADTTELALASALLQSFPGHPGHAPGRARQNLLALMQQGDLSPAQARLAKLRLVDLQREMALQSELQERDKRLKSLIKIESDLQQVAPQ